MLWDCEEMQTQLKAAGQGREAENADFQRMADWQNVDRDSGVCSRRRVCLNLLFRLFRAYIAHATQQKHTTLFEILHEIKFYLTFRFPAIRNMFSKPL